MNHPVKSAYCHARQRRLSCRVSSDGANVRKAFRRDAFHLQNNFTTFVRYDEVPFSRECAMRGRKVIRFLACGYSRAGTLVAHGKQ